jgi:pyruvate dehydrogenase E1 component beta subunit
LKSAVRDDNPVVVFESELMYNWKGDVPKEEYLVPIGEADIKREGKDVTIISFGKPVRVALSSAEQLEKKGVSAEIVDLRTLRPMDIEAIVKSVKKTNRCVVVDESWPICSVGSHVAWEVSNRCFDILDAEVELVSGEDVQIPYNTNLEKASQPSEEKVIDAVNKVLYRK